jgi:polyisoprenoid-binding protein YceI
MTIRLLTAALLSAACAAPAFAAPVEYVLDPNHTQVEFTWNHMGYSNITARIDRIEGRFTYDAENPAASSASATAHIDSLDSGVDKLDAHLKSADFFDAAKFPLATFTSTKAEAAGEGKLRLSGDLTIHGVTLPITFHVTLNKFGEHPMKKVPAGGFDAHATLKRSEFGMDMAVPNVSDEIRLEISAEAAAKPAA